MLWLQTVPKRQPEVKSGDILEERKEEGRSKKKEGRRKKEQLRRKKEEERREEEKRDE